MAYDSPTLELIARRSFSISTDHRRIRGAVGLLVALGSLGGCGATQPYDRVSGEGGATGGPSFSEVDLVVIRQELGVLAAQPPADPTNQFADNPAAAKLGQELFFDAGFSMNGKVACATCHDPSKGFQDDRAVSEGIHFTGRHAPSLLNSAYGSGSGDTTIWQFWDGRKDSLWAQALGPPENPNEMGSTRTKIALFIFDNYKTDYDAAFGPTMALPAVRDTNGAPVLPETATPTVSGSGWPSDPADPIAQEITRIYVNFGKAIAAYERKLVSRGSRFDQFLGDVLAGASDSDALTPEEKDGLRVFVGTGRCASCHLGPNLTDDKFHNVGVAQPTADPNVPMTDKGRLDGVAQVKSDEFRCSSEWSDQTDKTTCAVTALNSDAAADTGAFKTPSLRSVSLKAPYFHTGAVADLVKVVDFYNKGGDGMGFTGTVDKDVTKLDLTDAEKSHLVAFLAALDGAPVDPSLTKAKP